jgi:hypothetical protein
MRKAEFKAMKSILALLVLFGMQIVAISSASAYTKPPVVYACPGGGDCGGTVIHNVSNLGSTERYELRYCFAATTQPGLALDLTRTFIFAATSKINAYLQSQNQEIAVGFEEITCNGSQDFILPALEARTLEKMSQYYSGLLNVVVGSIKQRKNFGI